MKKVPHVSLENAQEVNEHFSRVQPNWALMRFVHFALGQYIRNDTVYEDGAKETVHDEIRSGKQMFIAHNHQSFYDPLVLGSILQKEKPFRPMRTRSAIPGKSPLFNHPLYGSIVRNSGAIPVFRRQEFGGNDEEAENARRAANNSQVTIMRANMNNGLHGAIYPEGTRGQDDGTYTEQEQTQKRDVTKLLPLHPGIGRIACGLERPENVSIVCIGTVFGPNHDDARHPTSYVAMPFPVANSVEGVVSETEATLQGALDAAVEIANR